MKIGNSIKFLISIWKIHCKRGEFVFLSSKNVVSGRWEDFSFVYDKNLKRKLQSWFDQHPLKSFDLYFCPLPFNNKRRKKKNVIRSKLLWADLDEVKPQKIDFDYKPSIYWQSSSGKYQSLWVLNKEIGPRKLNDLNKALTYKLGADKGGWNLGQVIRIPETINHKYEPPHKVKLLFYNKNKVFKVEDLMEKLELSNKQSSSTSLSEDNRPASSLSGEDIFKKYYNVIPSNIKKLLKAKEPEGDRSAVLWKMENELYDLGLSPPEIIALVRDSVWNKYKNRNDQNKRLRTELMKIIEGENIPEDEKKWKTKQSGPKPELIIDDYSSIIGSFRSKPGWLVEGFWLKRSHGIVAGEPKSFKSTLSLDLAVSVASGKDFLGKYPVKETGPVIIIQNENANWIMKDRLQKISSNRNLGGRVIKEKGDSLLVKFPPKLPLYFINQQMFLFNDTGHQKMIEKLIDRYNPVLIIFDPLYLMFEGDISSAQDLNPVLNWFLDLKNRTQTGIMLIHHWNKAQNSKRGGQKMLGSTTLHGWVESAWYIGIEDENKVVGSMVNEMSSVPSRLKLEREFRSAGSFPQISVDVKMGDMGEPEYGIEAQVYKKDTDISMEDVSKQIISYLELRSDRVTTKQICEQLGLKKRNIKKVLKELLTDNKVNMTSKGFKLSKE